MAAVAGLALLAQSPGRTPASIRPSFTPADSSETTPKLEELAPGSERLTFDIEWRLIHAGTMILESRKSDARMMLQSAGLVSALFKVNDTYTVNFDEPYCATSSSLDSQEGKRHHDTSVAFDRTLGKALFVERDLVKNSLIRQVDVPIPNCVQETVGALLRLRNVPLDPGKATQFPMSDGRRSANVRIEAQEREQIKTPAGTYPTIRYQADLLNGVIYSRKGTAQIWLTDDDFRVPIQIRLRMQFPIGSVTLQLAKQEHS